MKKLLLLLAVFPTIVHSQSISLDSLHREFERYLTGPRQPDIHANGETYTQFELKFEPDSESLLAGFAADNRRVIEYIGEHYHDLKNDYFLGHLDARSRFPSEVVDSQWRNLYFEFLTQLMVRYLTSKQQLMIEGVSLEDRSKITISHLQLSAAKFFYPDRVGFDGTILWHVCSGINGYMNAPPPREPMLEAFAFSVVYDHFTSPNDPISDEFDKAMKEAHNLNISDDNQSRLIRAQGFVFGFMAQDPILAKEIREMYAEKKDWLTFELN
jgi:hypothetical protein